MEAHVFQFLRLEDRGEHECTFEDYKEEAPYRRGSEKVMLTGVEWYGSSRQVGLGQRR